MKEIARQLNVAKSSVSMWVRDVRLSATAKKRLLTKIKLGQFVAAQKKREKTKATEDSYLMVAKKEIGKLRIDKGYMKLLCALIYWCEGVKNVKYGMAFINSDPNLVKTFLKLLRNSFEIDEKRFKPLIHLHSYHDKTQELDFWSKVTNINKEQFRKPYVKPNIGKRIRNDYHGCLSLRYFSSDLARRLAAFGKAYLLGGIVSTVKQLSPKEKFGVRILVPPPALRDAHEKIN